MAYRLLLTYLVSIAIFLSGSTAAAEITQLRLLHFNDVYEISPVHGHGGFAETMTLLEAKRNEVKHHLTTFGGDLISPSLLSSMLAGKQMVDLANQLDVDVAVYGNHEFDYGPDVLKQRVWESQFPWLASNVIDGYEAPFGGAVSQSSTYINNVKVCFFGVLTPKTQQLSFPGDDIRFLPVIPTAQKMVTTFQQEECQVIVGLTHLDFEEDRQLAREVKGIDLILGGHDHHPITYMEGDTLIFKVGHDLHYLGVVDLSINVNEDTTTTHVAHWELITTHQVTPHPTIAKAVHGYNAQLNSLLNKPIGQTAVDLSSQRHRVRGQESTMGNVIADAMVVATHADLALMNGGGIRGDTTYTAGSCLTQKDILRELPFGNKVLVLDMSGQDILDALEHGVSKIDDVAGRFLQVSHGFHYVFDRNQPVGQRIVSATLQGAPLDPNQRYRVATNDYLANGGDEFIMLPQHTKLTSPDTAEKTANLVIKYIQHHQPLTIELEGRIQEVE